MSFLAPEFLLQNLQSLTNTQDDMQTVSLFIRSNKNNYKMIIEVFSYEATKSNALHRLSLFYLANEIIQTEKNTDKAAVSLIIGIKQCIPHLFVKTIKELRSNDLIAKYRNLGKVWIERGIFEAEELDMRTDNSVDEILDRIREKYGKKDELIDYLKGLIMNLESKK